MECMWYLGSQFSVVPSPAYLLVDLELTKSAWLLASWPQRCARLCLPGAELVCAPSLLACILRLWVFI